MHRTQCIEKSNLSNPALEREKLFCICTKLSKLVSLKLLYRWDTSIGCWLKPQAEHCELQPPFPYNSDTSTKPHSMFILLCITKPNSMIWFIQTTNCLRIDLFALNSLLYLGYIFLLLLFFVIYVPIQILCFPFQFTGFYLP